MSQSCAKALVLAIPSAFSDVKSVDKQGVADEGGFAPAIKTMVAHQRVKAVDASGEKRDAVPRACQCPAIFPPVNFDGGRR
jgi:hypothetical protein